MPIRYVKLCLASQIVRNANKDKNLPAVAQWVKNLTAVVWVTVEVQVWSPAWHSGLKVLVLMPLHCRSQLWLGFSPWPGNFHMPQVPPLKKKKRQPILWLPSWQRFCLTRPFSAGKCMVKWVLPDTVLEECWQPHPTGKGLGSGH